MTAVETETVALKLSADGPMGGGDGAQTAAASVAPAAGPTSPVTPLPAALLAKLDKVSFKQSRELLDLRREFERLGKTDAACERWQALQQLLKQNRQHQQQLRSRLRGQLVALGEALEEGRSKEAIALWDRIQGGIQQCSDKLRTVMQKEAAAHKGEVLKLRDWRNYAATEKKRELIAEMAKLPNAGLAPPALARRIQQMHERWKALGRSEKNEKLWREFKTLSDKAHAPCKQYFQQRKQRMAQNLRARTEVCEKLEQKLTELSSGKIHILKLNQFAAECAAVWKQHAPLEQSKIKPLQKRYFMALKKLVQLRNAALDENTVRKRKCLARAKELAALEDAVRAGEEARKLQTEWKRLGPADFRVEKKLREEFRAVCDSIFKSRVEQQEKDRRRALPAARRRHIELLEQLRPWAECLQKLEEQLLDARDEDRFTELRRQIQPDAWNLPQGESESREGELEDERLALARTESLAAAAKLAEAAEARLRRVCTRLEIEAGAHSPPEDRALRMELQLQLLTTGFGKRGLDRKQLAENFRAAELSLLRDGPLRRDTRKRLTQRLEKLRRRGSPEEESDHLKSRPTGNPGRGGNRRRPLHANPAG